MGESGFDLAGIDDAPSPMLDSRKRRNQRLEAALRGRDRSRALILLAHRPRAFARARKLGVDLQLSGHTHGGQVWPGAWVIRLRDRWVAGHYCLGASQLYVSRGTGSFGPPYRLGSRSEITELVLRSKGTGSA